MLLANILRRLEQDLYAPQTCTRRPLLAQPGHSRGRRPAQQLLAPARHQHVRGWLRIYP